MRVPPAIFVALAVGACTAPSLGQQFPSPAPPSRDWPLERVALRDGREYFGLIESEDALWVNLAQVSRPPGRPMHVVLRPIERRQVAELARLDPPERAKLRERVEGFLNRAPIEAGRMEAVSLDSAERDGAVLHRYAGRWFTLESSVDESTTRRIVVRVEQVFTAYRQVLPPRCRPERPPQILVFGSPEDYQAYLARLGQKLDSPACYLRRENQVAAGSEVARFAAELAKINAGHENLRRELDALDRQLKDRLRDLAKEMQRQGGDRREANRLLLAEKRKSTELLDRKQKEIDRFDRDNARVFERVTGRMFARLYHEAFHAYLDNYVYPADECDVPPWLSEGLAVLFESVRIESDALRIDAPDPVALKKLKADLGSREPLPLAALLGAGYDRFAQPREEAAASDRYYLHAWGLVYYLAFERQLLGSAALDLYVRPPAVNPLNAAERFERLVGAPLPQFERVWRAYIAALR